MQSSCGGVAAGYAAANSGTSGNTKHAALLEEAMEDER